MKRITIEMTLDIYDEKIQNLPSWVTEKTDDEIKEYCDDMVFDFIRDSLGLEPSETIGCTQVENIEL